uniref:Uncharacterized protein n=1 Tax=uncultured prokaryote TaxID=198431 RepID=A0A0H5Q3X1_9ZZZZ|nr:hypothetical protein [uncultured prokaryote]
MPGISHLQLRLNGLIGANQTWSINPTFLWPPGSGSIPTQAVMDGWTAAVVALNGGDIIPDLGLLSNAVSLTGATGLFKNLDNATVVASERVLAAPRPGEGPPNLPGQISVVTTLQTNVPGRRARGRLYWPFLSLSPQSTDLRLSASAAAAIAGATAAWIQAVADAWPGPEAVVPAVVSQVGGTATPIVSVRVGDVFDTQRRRRDQLLETYAVAPL